MTSERSKRRDFLTLVFISKSISKKLLIKISKVSTYLRGSLFDLVYLMEVSVMRAILPSLL